MSTKSLQTRSSRYAALGGDQGVDFASALMPQHDSLVTIMSNTKGPTWSALRQLCAAISC